MISTASESGLVVKLPRRQFLILRYISRVAQAVAEHEKIAEALGLGTAGENRNENRRNDGERAKITCHGKRLFLDWEEIANQEGLRPHASS